jgi:(E)-4-hydroxy-3-methylbut-2-enyl-diphosphate synthase
MNYPLHLGVTEAGDGEDGRIKSAVGIGALLEDGLGDTIRVSLTEDPEFEIPVAKKLINKFSLKNNDFIIKTNLLVQYNPYLYERRHTFPIQNIGGKNVPIVFADLSKKEEINHTNFYGFGYNYSVPLDKWNLQDLAADFVYFGNKKLLFEIPGTLGAVFNYENWKNNYQNQKHCFPYLTEDEAKENKIDSLHFIEIEAEKINIEFCQNKPFTVFVLNTKFSNKTQLYRFVRAQFDANKIENPVILKYEENEADLETFQLSVSSDSGNQFIDGFGDGIWIKGTQPTTLINSLSFGILQATRTRISKTEYISCPSCGRTLFDLQETTAKIRNRTSHLKGIKIGIMGCIVNGPGEMADADYGYVGTGPGKIHLYKEKEIVRKNVPEKDAVDALIDLIKEHGDWIEPIKN